ncbi:hypothetical protein L1D16_15800 [Vibrio sp. Isolate31]|uniref:hypothetical protein n=1 Tax=unclassified Vibrio TaxID=2614977 RepID=UPI001EFEE692|nr:MULTISPECIES: hypothetical protein [unclassified Vibrio]MCG9554082.1 hypothetical protein [Vibrio sp. Isolate32]MCG9602276.1 hypothetical protein [Vibrio sp. Isolate31]
MVPAVVIESNKFKSVAPLISDDETFTDILERKLAGGNTDELGNFVIYEDDKVTIHFKNDEWPFLDSGLDFDGGGTNLVFDIDDGTNGYSNVLLMNDPISEIKYQLKAFALVSIYLSENQIQLSNLKTKLNELKKLVPVFLEHGVYDFTMLTDKKLEEITTCTPSVFNTRTRLEGLNALYDIIPWLPYSVHYSKLKAAMYSSGWREPDQYAVIPLRIYFDLMNWGKERVHYYKGLSSEIEYAVEKLLQFEEEELQRAIRQIRNGERTLQIGKETKGSKKFSRELQANGVELVDYGKNPLWMVCAP